MGYFGEFGSPGKLLSVFEQFTEGKNKITKSLREATVQKRADALTFLESITEDTDLDIADKIRFEIEHFGLPVTIDPTAHKLCAVVALDAKYSAKVKLYNIQTGRTGLMKIRKADFNRQSFEEGAILRINDWMNKPTYSFKEGKPVKNPGSFENWITSYDVL